MKVKIREKRARMLVSCMTRVSSKLIEGMLETSWQ